MFDPLFARETKPLPPLPAVVIPTLSSLVIKAPAFLISLIVSALDNATLGENLQTFSLSSNDSSSPRIDLSGLLGRASSLHLRDTHFSHLALLIPRSLFSEARFRTLTSVSFSHVETHPYFWPALREEGIFLKAISVLRVFPNLLDYLDSYEGLEKFWIVRQTNPTPWDVRSSFTTSLYRRGLTKHSQTMKELRIPAAWEEKEQGTSAGVIFSALNEELWGSFKNLERLELVLVPDLSLVAINLKKTTVRAPSSLSD
jgi:hypothetical protein